MSRSAKYVIAAGGWGVWSSYLQRSRGMNVADSFTIPGDRARRDANHSSQTDNPCRQRRSIRRFALPIREWSGKRSATFAFSCSLFGVDHLRTRRTPDPSRIEPGRDPNPGGCAASKLWTEKAPDGRAMLSAFHQRRHSIS